MTDELETVISAAETASAEWGRASECTGTCKAETRAEYITKASIQAYLKTKAFRLAAIEYVIDMDWPDEGNVIEYDTCTETAIVLLKQLQEEIENE